MLSLEQHRDVHQVELECGPAVVSFHSVEFEREQPEPSFAFAHIELYVPSPIGGYLLIFALSTPSLEDLPIYVSLMSQIGDSVTFSRDHGTVPQADGDDRPPRQRSTDDDVRSVFG
jgi:hypothetical protein